MKKHFTRMNRLASNQVANSWWCRLSVALIISISLPTLTFAQTKIWDKTLGGSGAESLASIQQTSDGGYILGGWSQSGKSGDKSQTNRDAAGGYYRDYWIVKLNADRTIAWDKTIGGNRTDWLKVVQQTTDGGYIVGGYSSSAKSGDRTEASRGGYDFWIVKLDINGNKVWDKTLGGDGNDELTSLQQTTDGGYILGGTSYSGLSGDKTQGTRGGSDYWIVKLNANGTKAWDKRFGGNSYEQFSSVEQTSDGGYILGGNSGSRATGDKTEASQGEDYWVVKLNSSGSKVWDKTIGREDHDWLKTIRQVPDGGYVLGGTSYSVGSGESDYWLVKLDNSGAKVWDKVLGGNKEDNFSSLHLTNDGNYLLSGYSDSEISGEKTESASGVWLIKVNAHGAKIWDKTIQASTNLLQLTQDGSYLLGGTSSAGVGGYKSEPSKGGSDYWLLKLDNDFFDSSNWNRAFGGAGSDNYTTTIKTSDGGYLSGGYTNSGSGYSKTQSSQGKNDYWIVKSDEYGQKLWDKRYGGTEDDYLNRIIQTQDGGYLLAGSTLSGISGDKTQASRGNRDYWVVKVDAQGTQQWDKRFGGSGYDELIKVIQLPGGEYVLGGYSNSPASGDKSQNSHGNTDYWLVKISSNGTKLWDKRYGGAGNETLGSFTVAQDGGFLLGGTSLSGASGDKVEPSRGSSDYWAVKTDKNGNLLWEKTYGGSNQDEVYSVGRSGNDYFLAGTSSSGTGGDKSQPGQGGKDYWLVKISATGTKLWDRSFGGSGNDELRASTLTQDGGYALAGSSYSGISGDKTQSSWGGSDYWLVQVNKDGEKVFDKRYGGTRTDELRTVFQTQDGGFLLGGRSYSANSGDKGQALIGFSGTDYWLMKVGPVTNSAIAVRHVAVAKKAVSPVKEILVQVYPNPFNERATISFSLPETQQVSVKVYDGQGNEVVTLFNGEAKAKQVYEVEWKAANKPAGLYFLQLQTLTQKHQQKLLLTK